MFLYVGWRILNGEIPYLHIWDHKPPLIFYLNALGLWLTGGSKWGVWLIELAALLLAAGLGFKLVKRIFGTTAAVVSLSLWLASLTLVIEGGNLTTEYTLPLQFACLWLVARLDEPKHETRQLFAIGLLCGLIFWTKQSLTGIAGAIALYLTISRSYARQWHRLGRDLVMLTAGFAIPTIGIVAYFANSWSTDAAVERRLRLQLCLYLQWLTPSTSLPDHPNKICRHRIIASRSDWLCGSLVDVAHASDLLSQSSDAAVGQLDRTAAGDAAF
ncbi:MAG: glycosyltransferase family 39 protein [Anaerolineae bacterium]